jgi:DNA-binding CsgD family transcriptional regulator
MHSMTLIDERAILEASHRLLACDSFVELTHTTLHALEALLGADSSCFSLSYQSDEERRLERLCGFGRVTTEDLRLYSETYLRADPVLDGMLAREWIGLNRIVVLERLVDMGRFTDTQIYSDFFRPRAIHHVMGMSITLGDDTRALIGLHLPRTPGAGFDARHIEVAKRMVPAVAAGFTQCLLREQIHDREAIIEALARGEPRRGLVVLDSRLRVLYLDPAAHSYLRRLRSSEGDFHLTKLALPPRLRRRVAQAVAGDMPPDVVHVIDPAELGRDRGIPRMSLKPLGGAGANARYLLAFDAPRQRDTAVGTELGRLSARETEVAEHVAQGLSNAEVAQRLHLSVRTVENHLRSIYGKLEVRNRTALARMLGIARIH